MIEQMLCLKYDIAHARSVYRPCFFVARACGFSSQTIRKKNKKFRQVWRVGVCGINLLISSIEMTYLSLPYPKNLPYLRLFSDRQSKDVSGCRNIFHLHPNLPCLNQAYENDISKIIF